MFYVFLCSCFFLFFLGGGGGDSWFDVLISFFSFFVLRGEGGGLSRFSFSFFLFGGGMFG